ncbi:CCA tRNA nucleotidyltransferase [Pseudarthrobacter oxydans]|uniref:CCA tRNA nucleotidyltransferase n=1 Tax=Pseudarthrobacter oxydans TaxID=1671 RepID=UPI0035ED0DA9
MTIEDVVSPVYLVGGSVRDKLLGTRPADYDYATPMLPDDVEAAVRAAGIRPGLLGKRFGTIDFKLNGQHIEVTTFRQEQYGGTRRPEVQYVQSIEKDLARRDFTINAMAQRGDRIIDPFGGRADIEGQTIRAVGRPSERFSEDPLRMLRAARFTGQLGFTIEPSTQKAIIKQAHKILSVSRERWVQELDKLLVGEYVQGGIAALYSTDLIKYLLPELRLQKDYDQNSDWHEYTLDEHTARTVTGVPAEPDLRWAAWLHDIGKPFVRAENKRGRSNYVHHEVIGAEIVQGIGRRLKWSNERTERISQLILHHLEDDSPLRQADNSSKRLTAELPPSRKQSAPPQSARKS